MQVRDVTPPGLSFAAGAAKGLQGVYQAQQEQQAADIEQRKLALQEGDNARRNAYLSLAEQEMKLAFEKHAETQRVNSANISARERARASRSTVAKLLGNAYSQPTSTGELPPEIQSAMDAAVQSGDPDLVQSVGTLAETAKARQFADHAVNEIVNDNVPSMDGQPSVWSAAGATGMQPVDVNGDGQPDEWQSVPEMYQARLRSGINPKTGKPEHPANVLAEYRSLRDGILQQLEMRRVWAEEGAKVQAEYAPIEAGSKPQDRSAARVILRKLSSGWYDHEYPGNPALAQQIGREEYAMRLQGFEAHQDRETGAISYVKTEDKEAAQARDGMLDQAKGFVQAMGDVVSQAIKIAGDQPKPDATTGAIDPAQMKAWDDRYHAALGEMIDKMLPTTFKAERGRQMFQGVQMPPTLDVKPPPKTKPVERSTWNTLSPEMQTSTRDALTNAAKATAEGQDPTALPRAIDELKAQGVDLESLPPEVITQIEALFSDKKRKPNSMPEVTHGEPPSWAREP